MAARPFGAHTFLWTRSVNRIKFSWRSSDRLSCLVWCPLTCCAVHLQELYVNPEDDDTAATEQGGGLLEVAAHLGVRLLQKGPSPGTLALDPKALWHVIDALRRSGAQVLGISTARVVTELVEAEEQLLKPKVSTVAESDSTAGVHTREIQEEHLVPRP